MPRTKKTTNGKVETIFMKQSKMACGTLYR